MAVSVEGGSRCIWSRLRNLLAPESWLSRRRFRLGDVAGMDAADDGKSMRVILRVISRVESESEARARRGLSLSGGW
jgi:hypothetical protein